MITNIATHLTTTMVDSWNAGNCPVIYDNQPEVDYSDQPIWARFAVRFGDQTQESLGTQKITDQKLRLILQVFVRKGEGSGPAYGQAEAFANIFRYYRFKSVPFSIAGREPQLQTYDDADWYQVNISIPLIATFIV